MAMVIRSTQIAAFRSPIEGRYDCDLAKYAQHGFPNVFQAVPEDRVLALVHQVRETALRFGVERQDDLATLTFG